MDRVAAFAVAACADLRDRRADRPGGTHRCPTREVGRRRAARAAADVRVPVGLTPVVRAGPGRRRDPRLAHARDAGAGGRRRTASPSAYRLIDTEVLGLGVGRPAGPAGLGRAARVRRAQRHPPVQAGGRPAARRALRGRRRPRCGQHRRVPGRPSGRPQHRLVGLQPGVPCGAARARSRTAPCSSARAAPGSRSGTACCEQGAEHVAVLDADGERARSLRRAAGQALRRRPGRHGERPGVGPRRRRGVVNATPVGMHGPSRHGRSRAPAPRRPLGQRRRLLPARDRAGRTGPGPRLPRASGRRHGGPPGGRRVRAVHRPHPDAARMSRHFEELAG